MESRNSETNEHGAKKTTEVLIYGDEEFRRTQECERKFTKNGWVVIQTHPESSNSLFSEPITTRLCHRTSRPTSDMI
jgi:hypothetical protein